MKNYILSITLLLCSIFVFGQEEKSLGVFESDTTWLSEIIKFPIGFAPEITYQGYEDLRFAKKWRDSTHEEFWCYTFAWHINSHEIQNIDTLEANIKFYYDGIMKAVNKKKDFTVPKTSVSFTENIDNTKDIDYIGKIEVYDSFNTEDMLSLSVSVKVYYCENKKSTTVVFRLSPQNFDHAIWKRFEEIKLKSNLCE